MRRPRMLPICCTLLGLVATCGAAPILFDFGGTPTGPVGASSRSVTEGIYTLTAYGFDANNTPHNLYFKNEGTDEHGLGLVNTNDNELTLTSNPRGIANYMQIDVSQVYGVFPTGQLRVQSVTSGEEFDVYGSNTLGSIGTVISSGNTLDNDFLTLPNWGIYKFISVAVTPQAGSSHNDDNVLVDAIQVVPEPTALPLVILGGLTVLRIRAIRAHR